jgi:hypothetical protein
MRGMMANPGQPLDHQRDPVQGPQLPREAVGRGASEQGLLDGSELLVRKPWRRTARPFAAQRLTPAARPAAVPDADSLGRNLELAGDLGLADASGEQLGRLQPAGLELLTVSLGRRAARDGWHGADPHPPNSPARMKVSRPVCVVGRLGRG